MGKFNSLWTKSSERRTTEMKNFLLSNICSLCAHLMPLKSIRIRETNFAVSSAFLCSPTPHSFSSPLEDDEVEPKGKTRTNSWCYKYAKRIGMVPMKTELKNDKKGMKREDKDRTGKNSISTDLFSPVFLLL